MNPQLIGIIVKSAATVVASAAGKFAGNAAWEVCKLTYKALTYNESKNVKKR